MVKPYEDPRMQVDLAGVTMKTPVTTASGTFGFGLEFTDFLNLDHIGAITVKGTTLKPRPGNKGQRVVETPAGVLNCVGLENPGVEFFLKETLPQLRKVTKTPVIVNIDGDSAEDYGTLAEMLDVDGVDAIELNISCPNVAQGGLAFGTDCHAAGEVVKAAKARTHKPVITKLSPMSTDITEIARAVKRRAPMPQPDQHPGGHEDRHLEAAAGAGEYRGRPFGPGGAPGGGAHGVPGGPGGEGAPHRHGRHQQLAGCGGIHPGRGHGCGCGHLQLYGSQPGGNHQPGDPAVSGPHGSGISGRDPGTGPAGTELRRNDPWMQETD